MIIGIPKKWLWLLVGFIALISLSNTGVYSQASPVDPQDSLVLVEFQNELRAVGWPDFWDASEPARAWRGIFWEPGTGGKVRDIDLSGASQSFSTEQLPQAISMLKDLDHLRALFLTGFGFKRIAPGIGELLQINTLHLGHNELLGLPTEINNLKNLQILILDNNDFESIPGISGLTALKQLALTQNYRLTTLDIPKLDSLENLRADFCPIETLPESIGQLSRLEVLDLDQCKLTSLPATMANLTALRELTMLRNEFTSLPPVVGSIPSLQLLDVSFNKLTSLPSELNALSNLINIRFNHNLLTQFPLSIVGLPSLRGVKGDNNQMTGSLPPGLFTAPGMLIDLSNNHLSGEIRLGAGDRVPQQLDISGNRFQLKDIHALYPALIGAGTSFTFNAQQLIGTNAIIIPGVGEDVTVSVDGYTPMPGAVVQWYRVPTVGSNGPGQFVEQATALLLERFDPASDAGVYYCEVTHPDLPGLMLESEEIRVIGANDPPSLFAEDLTFRRNNIPILTFNGSDDYTNIEDLVWEISNSTHFSFTELPSFGIEQREIRLNDPNWLGSEEIELTVSDEQDNTTSQVITLTVVGETNAPPTFLSVPPIYMSFDFSIPTGSPTCPNTYFYSSTTTLDPYVIDDLDALEDLTLRLDPTDTLGFAEANLFVSLVDVGAQKQIDALVSSCQDTTFSVMFTMEVTDLDGSMSTQEITLINDPTNAPPTVSPIPTQQVVKGATSFPVLDLGLYVTDDALTIDQLDFDVISLSAIDLHFEKFNETVLVHATPFYLDSSYTETVDILVSESTNPRFNAQFTIEYEILETGITISGKITTEDLDPVEGVIITGFQTPVLTDPNGSYFAEVPPGWSGTVIPFLANYVFDPVAINLINVQANIENNDFVATFTGKYRVSGTIRDGSGTPVEGVSLLGFPTPVVTNTLGFYEVLVEPGWSGEIRPVLEGYIFDPATITFQGVSSNSENNDFLAIPNLETYKVSGFVRDGSGIGMEGVVMEGFPLMIVTNALGFYETALEKGWSGEITPVRDNFQFTPGSITISDLDFDSPGNDFTGEQIRFYHIEGTVLDSFGRALENVILEGFPSHVITNASGKYRAEVPGGWSGVVSPSLPRYSFSPQALSFESVQSDLQDQDFKGTFTGKYVISGRILDGGNEPLVGVSLIGLSAEATTDANGFYEIEVSPGWSGVITPNRDGFTFEPALLNYENVDRDMGEQDYRAVLVTSVGEITETPWMTVYPNPTAGPLQVKFGKKPQNALLTLTDTQGKTFHKVKLGSDNAAVYWDGRDPVGMPVSPGTYYLKLTSGKEVLSIVKIMILK